MSNYQYILSLTDKVSGTLQKITGVTSEAHSKFTKLKSETKILDKYVKDFGGSITSLQKKMEILKGERNLLDPKNLTVIRQYNTEIKGLAKEINKLETINGSKFKNNLKSAIGEIPSVLRNPVAMGAAAVGYAGKSAMNFDQGMAAVNVTAQLDEGSLKLLSAKVRDIADRNKADMTLAPIGLEKIISQTGDVDLSLSILDASLKGAKAGFTDLDTVSASVAQTLSIVGKEKTTAQEVLDTFFAAKRVGAGEFKDFAQYMPGLIAGADALGVNYKNVAGVFAYMTGKGQSAERASVLMNNMFSAMGKTEISDKLSKAGIKIFDKAGKMRSVVDIFKDLNSVMGSMNDEQKTKFLDAVGIKDKEAKASFAIMSSDVNQLSESLNDCNNSMGETDKALSFSANSMQKAAEVWNKLKNIGTEFGISLLPIINAGLTFFGGTLSLAVPVVQSILEATSWWVESLKDGNPWIWGLTAALGASLVMIKAHVIWLQLTSLWNTITTGSTGLLTKAIGFLKLAFITTPWGWIALAIGAVAGALAGLMSKTDGAAKSYANFTLELQRNKKESQDAFQSAKSATIGTDQRTESIRKINEKYGEYLPNLLSEKASNDDLAAALNIVNIELERKLKNKFRDQAIESAQARFNEIETQAYQYISNEVAPQKRKQALAELRNEIDGIKSGKKTGRDFQEGFGRKYNLGSESGLSRINGYGPKLQEAAQNLSRSMESINAQYDDTKRQPPQTPVINNFFAAPAANSFAPSWLQPKTEQPTKPWRFGEGAEIKTTKPVSTPATNQPLAYDQVMKNLGGGGSSGSGGSSGGGSYGGSGGGSKIDLDKVAPQAIKGSTAYNAIVSKIASVRLPSLAKAAATVALPLSVAATELPTSEPFDSFSSSTSGKTITMEKFCNQIVINIEKSDGKGHDRIRAEIVKTIEEIIGSYDSQV